MTSRISQVTLSKSIGLGAIALISLSGLAFAADATSQPVTFAKDIAPIFQEKCQDCHRKGGMAPMALLTYEETRPWARSIKERVIARQMPPWHLDKSVGIQHFKNDMSLSDEQVSMITRWVDSGSPQGNPKDMPAAKTFPSDTEWNLAKEFGRPPDMIIKSTDYTMPAVNQDQWWRPVVDPHVTEPLWVRAVEMRPGTPAGRKITHHALAHLIQDDPDARKFSDNIDGGGGPNEGGTLMEWAVGKNYDIYTPGTGKLLLPGAKIWWDIHYHAVGEQITDHVELGVWLYPKNEPPKYRTYLTGFSSLKRNAGGTPIDIAPNSMAMFQGYTVLKAPARLGNFQPHFHLRGKAMEIEAIYPDGKTEVLSYVDHFNFNWMTNYIYTDDAAPVLPKGTIVHVTSWYDNTTANKFNPDPNQWVGYGDRTVDEMGHAWVNVTYISDEDYAAYVAAHKPVTPARAASGAR